MGSNQDMPTGGEGGRFPATRHSAILALRGDDAEERQRALETIATIYWRPVYTHLRLCWNRNAEDARDLVQGFFLEVLEKGFLASFDPQRARFRTFLRLCLDRFVQREDASASRQKRGGGIEFVPLDIGDVEEFISVSSQGTAPDDSFDIEWTRSLLSLATRRLRDHCLANGHEKAHQAFQRYDLDPAESGERPSYAELAEELGTTVVDITNQLAYARGEFRAIVLGLLREMTASDEEFRDEARALLGIDVK